MKPALRFPLPQHLRTVVFSDIDGTLIDHHTYAATASLPAIQWLAERDIPLVFCSSKTLAEQECLQQELGIRHPCILENGSAIAIPAGYFKRLPRAFTRLRMERHSGFEVFVLAHATIDDLYRLLDNVPGIRSFRDATDAEMYAATQLEGDALKNARLRMFTETLLRIPEGTDFKVFVTYLSDAGWQLSRGGRFHTIHSAQVNKGLAVKCLKKAYRLNSTAPFVFAAIGDSHNDAPMLAAADCSFLVRKHDDSWASIRVRGLVKTALAGPAGFTQAVRMMLGG